MNSDDLTSLIIYISLFLFIMALGISSVLMTTAQAQTIEDIESFLVNDTTDTRQYLLYYTCGHFSRDLAYNASMQNISIGSVILGNHPVLRGHDNHVVNYVMVNETIVIICPRTDRMLALNPGLEFYGVHYRYYRLYPDGTQVPSNWKYNLATKSII